MAEEHGKNRIDEKAEERLSAAEYYQLHTKAVEDLVTADVSNTPKYAEEELNRYRRKRGIRIADWVKVLFIKYWFAGMACFFFLWGLGSYLATVIDQLFVLGMALGIITDLFTNNAIRFFEKTPGDHDRWMMFPRKRYISFFLNILYAFVLLFFVYTLYQFINVTAAAATGQTDRVALGVGPLLFALFYLGFDLLFLGCKKLLKRIVEDAKAKA